MVEFALILPLFMMLLLGALGFGIAFHAQQELSTAAQEGARLLYVGRPAGEAQTAAFNAVRLSPAYGSRAGDGVTVTACSAGQRAVEARRTETVDFLLGTRVLNIRGRAVAPCTP